MKTFVKDKLNVEIFETRKEMGEKAAKDIAVKFNSLIAEKGEINVIWAAAPSQNDVLKALTEDTTIAWNKINAFHMDEYIGLDKDAPQGFGNFLYDHIFSKAPFKSVHYIRDCGTTADEICNGYKQVLKNFPPDVVFMGIGENAHIAFNDPAFAKFDDPEPVKVVELDDICRNQQVNDGCFAKFDDVPTHAITLTIPTLMSAKRLFCMVPRATKAEAVKRVYEGEIEELCPASIMRTHDNAIMYCDADSAKHIV